MIDELQDAIDQERALRVHYTKQDGAADWRTISPWQFTESGNLLLFDHGREAIRQFNPDGIDEIESSPQSEFVRPRT